MTLSYRDVMLDWAVSELMSPHWQNDPNCVWAHPVWQPWRDHVRKTGRDAWTQRQADMLVQVLAEFRRPIISVYGPRPDWSFERQYLSHSELGQSRVMAEFFPPGGSAQQLAHWVRDNPDYAPEKSKALDSIVTEASHGRWPEGTPIIVADRSKGHVLIEGYKRVIAYLTLGAQKTPVIVAKAPN